MALDPPAAHYGFPSAAGSLARQSSRQPKPSSSRHAMLGIHDFAWFLLAGLLLNITPGADMLFILTRTTAKGARAGAAAALGVGAGCLVHVTAAAAGLSALVAASNTAFAVVK